METFYISNYEIANELGSGGFGKVYEAESIFSDKVVAVKILKKEKMNDISMRRFEREVKIHTQLRHNNIVPIIDFNLDDNGENLYYTMPLAKCNFSTFLAKYREDNLRPMDDDTAAFYFRQLLDAMEYAHHEEGVIHRDLKPQNILVYDVDTLKISDFGLGKFIYRDVTTLTQTRTALGNDVYAAPEQWEDRNARNVDERADIFSLGKIFYEMLTNRLPLTINRDLISNSKFRYLIKKATRNNIERRYSTIQEIRRDFDLLNGSNEYSFKNPSQEFTKNLDIYNEANDVSALDNLLDILIANCDDYMLYTKNYMALDKNLLQKLYNRSSEKFYEAVDNYLRHIEGEHAFNFTDKITLFLINVYEVNPDNEDFFEIIFERILTLGYDHHRFFIARKFGTYLTKIRRLNFQLIMKDILEKNPRASRWIKGYSDINQMADIIRNTLINI